MPIPDMSEALFDWETSVLFSLVTKTVVDFEVSEAAAINVTFLGVYYPMKPTQIALKPEGQRTWQWWTMITTKQLSLDDIIVDPNSVDFRVMVKKDYSQSGFYEYELTEKFSS